MCFAWFFHRQTDVGPLVSSARRSADNQLAKRMFCLSFGLTSIRLFVLPKRDIGYSWSLCPKKQVGRSLSEPPRGRVRSSVPKVEDGGVLRSSGSKKKWGRVLRSSGSEMRRWGGGSPMFRLRIEEPPISHLPSSIFGPEEGRTPHLRSSAPENEEPIYDLRARRMDRKSDGRRGGGGATSSKMGRDLRRWGGSSIFRVRRTKNPPSSIFGSGRTKKRPMFHLLGQQDEKPRHLLLPAPHFDQRPPAPLSYPGIWMFSPVFHFEDRSEDRDRPSTPFISLSELTCRHPVLPRPVALPCLPAVRRLAPAARSLYAASPWQLVVCLDFKFDRSVYIYFSLFFLSKRRSERTLRCSEEL